MDSSHGGSLTSQGFTAPSLLPSLEEKRSLSTVNITDHIPTYAKELIAGGAAGGFSKTVVAPLERTKILFQTQNATFRSLGLLRSLNHIYKNEGLLGFYKGNGASVMRIVPYAALHFMAYEQYRRCIVNWYPIGTTPGATVDLVAGSLAGGTAVLCTYPLDLARTTLAYQVKDATGTYPYKGIKHVFSKVLKESGVRGLYRGIGPTLYGMLPYAGLKFYVYEKLKGSLPEDCQSSISVKLACGAIAGIMGQTFTYPLDVVRRQMQVQAVGHPNQTYRTTIDGLVSIARMYGARQLFAGLSINYIKLVPSVAIGFATYDGLKSLLRVPPREKRGKKLDS